jgi:deoxyribonuclease V
LGAPALIAGIDVGFEDRGRVTRAAAAVLRTQRPTRRDRALGRRGAGGSAGGRVRAGAPADRISVGAWLLSFREIPAVLEALAALARTPDLLLADGWDLSTQGASASFATWAGCSTRRPSASPSPAIG